MSLKNTKLWVKLIRGFAVVLRLSSKDLMDQVITRINEYSQAFSIFANSTDREKQVLET